MFIKNAILEAIHQFTPSCSPDTGPTVARPRWFTQEIQNQLNCVHTIRRKARTRPTPINISKLNAAELASAVDRHAKSKTFIQVLFTTKFTH